MNTRFPLHQIHAEGRAQPANRNETLVRQLLHKLPRPHLDKEAALKAAIDGEPTWQQKAALPPAVPLFSAAWEARRRSEWTGLLRDLESPNAEGCLCQRGWRSIDRARAAALVGGGYVALWLLDSCSLHQLIFFAKKTMASWPPGVSAILRTLGPRYANPLPRAEWLLTRYDFIQRSEAGELKAALATIISIGPVGLIDCVDYLTAGSPCRLTAVGQSSPEAMAASALLALAGAPIPPMALSAGLAPPIHSEQPKPPKPPTQRRGEGTGTPLVMPLTIRSQDNARRTGWKSA